MDTKSLMTTNTTHSMTLLVPLKQEIHGEIVTRCESEHSNRDMDAVEKNDL